MSKKEFGSSWPLTVAEGRVNCIPNGGGGVEAVFTSNDEKRYALNGTAKSGMTSGDYLDVDGIWADDPEIEGAKKDISVLIDVCQPLM